MIVAQSSSNSPKGCGKLATFHVVARDEVSGDIAKSSRPGGAPDIRPIPSHRSHQPPHLDSGHPKSTIDLGCQRLIWGDHALFRLPNTEPTCLKPPEILGNSRVSRNQTEIKPNQAKKLFPTVDLGCLESSSSSTCFSYRKSLKNSKPLQVAESGCNRLKPPSPPRGIFSATATRRERLSNGRPAQSNPVQASPTYLEIFSIHPALSLCLKIITRPKTWYFSETSPP
jgi:hypothetical protein